MTTTTGVLETAVEELAYVLAIATGPMDGGLYWPITSGLIGEQLDRAMEDGDFEEFAAAEHRRIAFNLARQAACGSHDADSFTTRIVRYGAHVRALRDIEDRLQRCIQTRSGSIISAYRGVGRTLLEERHGALAAAVPADPFSQV